MARCLIGVLSFQVNISAEWILLIVIEADDVCWMNRVFFSFSIQMLSEKDQSFLSLNMIAFHDFRQMVERQLIA